MNNIKIEDIQEIEKEIDGAEHLMEVSYRVIGDERLLLKSFEMIYKAVLKLRKLNEKINLNERDKILLNELLELGDIHKNSGFEFPRNGSMVIFDDKDGEFILSKDKTSNFITLAKALLNNTQSKIKAHF